MISFLGRTARFQPGQFHSRDESFHRSFRLPRGQSDFVAANPDAVGPTSRQIISAPATNFIAANSDVAASPDYVGGMRKSSKSMTNILCFACLLAAITLNAFGCGSAAVGNVRVRAFSPEVSP